MYGDQVWCKCNYVSVRGGGAGEQPADADDDPQTASTIQPWPLVEGLDFQSYHTLRMMHEANEVGRGVLSRNHSN